jgi:hypothetical protein
MELSKCDFEFDSINLNIESLDLNQTLLWILHADKIPPHIGISTNGKYFSLKVNGKDEQLPVGKLLTTIQNKKISVVVIATSRTLGLDEIREKYLQFQKAEDLKNTCLTPIKELLTADANVSKLKDLLETLNNIGEIQQVYGLNLVSTYKGIPFYTTEEIRKRLELLKNAQG